MTVISLLKTQFSQIWLFWGVGWGDQIPNRHSSFILDVLTAFCFSPKSQTVIDIWVYVYLCRNKRPKITAWTDTAHQVIKICSPLLVLGVVQGFKEATYSLARFVYMCVFVCVLTWLLKCTNNVCVCVLTGEHVLYLSVCGHCKCLKRQLIIKEYSAITQRLLHAAL